MDFDDFLGEDIMGELAGLDWDDPANGGDGSNWGSLNPTEILNQVPQLVGIVEGMTQDEQGGFWDWLGNTFGGAVGGIADAVGNIFVGDDGQVNRGAISALLSLAGFAAARNSDGSTTYGMRQMPSIKPKVMVRNQVPMDPDQDRRPGSSGRRYFTDAQFVNMDDAEAMEAAQELANTQEQELVEYNQNLFDLWGETNPEERTVEGPTDLTWDYEVGDDILSQPVDFTQPDPSEYGEGAETPPDIADNPPDVPPDPVVNPEDPPGPTDPPPWAGDPVNPDPVEPDPDDWERNEFLNQMYQEVLGRDIGREGNDYWQAALAEMNADPNDDKDERWLQSQIAGGAWPSGELNYEGNRDEMVRDMYLELFGRNPNKGGLDYWLSTGLEGDALRQAMIGGAQGEDKNYYDTHFNIQTQGGGLGDLVGDLVNNNPIPEGRGVADGPIESLTTGQPPDYMVDDFQGSGSTGSGLGSITVTHSRDVAPEDRTVEQQRAVGTGKAGVNAEFRLDEDGVMRMYPTGTMNGFAHGGLATALPGVQGYYMGGITDGMGDQIPAHIDGNQPAALSDGEFVVPADVVSHLGNGNSNAGAMQLHEMMAQIRKARTGNPHQGAPINPKQFLPG